MPAVQYMGDGCCMLHRPVVGEDFVPFVDCVSIRVDYCSVPLSCECLHGFLKKGGFPQVVLIEKCHKLAFCKPCTVIACNGLSAILSSAEIARLWKGQNEPGSFIFRCIVHHDELEVPMGLC